MPDMSAIANPQQRSFNPYAENGGTILAVAGADFTVIAGDTRQSEGYSIQTRYAPKVFRLYAICLTIISHRVHAFLFRTDRAVLAVNGFAADGNMFVKKVKQRLEVLVPSPHLDPIVYSDVSVVSACPRKRYAATRDSTSYSNDALRATLLPILCLQHSWGH